MSFLTGKTTIEALNASISQAAGRDDETELAFGQVKAVQTILVYDKVEKELIIYQVPKGETEEQEIYKSKSPADIVENWNELVGDNFTSWL